MTKILYRKTMPANSAIQFRVVPYLPIAVQLLPLLPSQFNSSEFQLALDCKRSFQLVWKHDTRNINGSPFDRFREDHLRESNEGKDRLRCNCTTITEVSKVNKISGRLSMTTAKVHVWLLIALVTCFIDNSTHSFTGFLG